MPFVPDLSDRLVQVGFPAALAEELQTAIQGSVSGDRKVAFSVKGTCHPTVYGQLPDGRYICTDHQSNVLGGGYKQQLYLMTGHPLTPGWGVTTLPYTWCSASSPDPLLDSTGAGISGAAAAITNTWDTSNGDIYFVARQHATTSYHLFRAKSGTYTVGANAAYTDRKACIDLGRNGGVQVPNIRALSSRSFLEATVNGGKHYFFCEYNVSTGRVSGSGGAGSDQVVVYRSTDLGNTWAVFFEWNTNGSHQISHVHGARQDPYTGWIYFMTGDITTENSLIAYNGIGAVVAANATLATIAATPGYKVLNGNELVRFTDLCFTSSVIYGIPDADSETYEAATTAFVATNHPKTLDYSVTIAPIPTRINKIPPLLSIQTATWAAYVSFRTHTAPGNPEQYLHLWTSDYRGGSWTLTNKIALYETGGNSYPLSFFIDLAGDVWIGGRPADGMKLTSLTAPTDQIQSSVCLSVTDRPAASPAVFVGG